MGMQSSLLKRKTPLAELLLQGCVYGGGGAAISCNWWGVEGKEKDKKTERESVLEWEDKI